MNFKKIFAIIVKGTYPECWF